MICFPGLLIPGLTLIQGLLFTHYTVSTDLPADPSARFGMPAMADFDNDGDMDFALSRTHDSVYIFEMVKAGLWIKHCIGTIPTGQLAGGACDVDRDGWQDIVTGGHWYRNPGQAFKEPFQRFHYDTAIVSEIHDLVFTCIDGDMEPDLVVLGDKTGCWWYDIPDDPLSGAQWEKHLITLDVLDDKADIHGGFFPGGVGDLDMDGDADLVLVGRWYRNDGEGRSWSRKFLPFGSGGYWGLSARSWITDMDKDGDNDIVMAACDQIDSRCVWLESDGNPDPQFRVHLLPLTEPGRRGSFHSLWVADFDMDGDPDVFSMEQEDSSILPQGASMKAFIWENMDGLGGAFTEHVVLDKNIGGHDVLFGDADGDGDLDAYFKIWRALSTNGYGGKPHVDYLENRTR
jgi:hypothetical protein